MNGQRRGFSTKKTNEEIVWEKDYGFSMMMFFLVFSTMHIEEEQIIHI